MISYSLQKKHHSATTCLMLFIFMKERKVISELVCEHCNIHFISEYLTTDKSVVCDGYCKKETSIIVVANQFKDMCDWCPEIEGFCAYILMCSNGKMYKGHTNDFKRRMREHFNSQGCKTTQMNIPKYILHYEVFETRKEAVAREKFFKRRFDWIKSNEKTLNSIYPL